MHRLLLWSGLCLLVACQSLVDSSLPKPLPDNSPQPFPEAWLGTYTGTLHIFTRDSVLRRIPMRFGLIDLDSAGCMRWELTYYVDTDVEDHRSYLLAPHLPKRGLYLLDELNSIEMHVQSIYDELISIFEVMGNRLVFCYRKINKDQILLSVYTHSNNQALESGDTTYAGEEIPAVSSFLVSGVQRALLTRSK